MTAALDHAPGNVVGDIRAGIERVGWTETARRSGIYRPTLHRSFGEGGHPTLRTIERVIPHLGLRLIVEPIAQ